MDKKEIENYVKTIKAFDIPEINEAMRYIDSALYERECYEKYFKQMVEVYKNILPIIYKDKNIELNKTYWVTEWSWSPMCDGRYAYEETIREHAVINNIDCYFTNKNNRVYFKEDIYNNKEDALKALKWQNSFAYDYNDIVSREHDIMSLIEFENFHWKYRTE